MKLRVLLPVAFSVVFAIAATITIPLTPSLWRLEHVSGNITHPALVNGALSFDFPQYPNGDWVNYLDVQYGNKVDISSSGYLNMTISVTTTGTPTFRYDSNPDNTCIVPAHVRPYFAVSQSNSEYNTTGRWWSNPVAYQLAAGSITLSIPLTPQSWSDVNGEFGNLNATTLSRFAATKAAVQEIGMTFGGGCFFGHGVSVQNGTATFQLLNYSITDSAVAQCSYTLDSGGQAFPVGGGNAAVNVTSPVGCNWNVTGAPNWVTFAGAMSGSGNGALSYQVGTNSGSDRSATMTVGGVPFVVEQEAVIAGLSFIGSMPQIAAEENWTTEFTLVNKGAAAAEARLSLFGDPIDPSGSGPLLLPLEFPQQPPAAGPILAASFDSGLAANASLLVSTEELQTSPVLVGSAQLQATGPVDGFAIFHLIPNGQEAAVPLETRNANSYLLAFDNTNGVALGVAVDNASAQAANIGIVLRDDMGAQIGPAGATIPLSGNGHTAFVLSSRYPVTANLRGTVEFDTPAGGEIGVLGIRTTPFGSNNTLTTVPALANVGTSGGSVAHIATGNGWQTTFVLVNTGSSAAQMNLDFFDDSGAPLSLPLSFPQSGGPAAALAPAVNQLLAAGATLIIQSAAPESDPAPTIGSAQLTTNGNVGGFVIFRYNPNGQEAVVPIETRNANAYLLAFDGTDGTATGVAINSVSNQAVNIPVVVRDDTGAQIATDTISLAANGHLAFTLAADRYPVAANIRGTIEFDTPANAQIGALGIRMPAGAHTFTTLPALAK